MPKTFSRLWSKLLFRIDDLSLKNIFALLFLAIIIFSITYYILSFYNNGPVLTYNVSQGVSFGDCIYFSIVTISSLGYGDMRPQGLSKVASCLEVLIGLGFLGLIVSKIASWKQDYQLRRIYSLTTKQFLDKFCDSLANCYLKYKDFLEKVLLEKSDDCNPLQIPTNKKQLKTFNNQLQIVCRALKSHLVYETRKGEYFAEIEAGSIINLLKPISSILRLRVNLPKDCRTAFTEASNKRKPHHTLTFFSDICNIISRNVSHDVVNKQCMNIMEQASLA